MKGSGLAVGGSINSSDAVLIGYYMGDPSVFVA
jgi:hypothetical protein